MAAAKKAGKPKPVIAKPALYEIYALCCPTTGDIRYVGKANDSKKRLKSHLRDSRRRNTPVYCWIRKLQANSQTPELKILEVTENWVQSERRLIELHRASGRLLNVAEGGDEPYCSYETMADNARKVVKIRQENPYNLAVWKLKNRMLMNLNFFIKHGDKKLEDAHREKMRLCAQKRPDICADWALV